MTTRINESSIETPASLFAEDELPARVGVFPSHQPLTINQQSVQRALFPKPYPLPAFLHAWGVTPAEDMFGASVVGRWEDEHADEGDMTQEQADYGFTTEEAIDRAEGTIADYMVMSSSIEMNAVHLRERAVSCVFWSVPSHARMEGGPFCCDFISAYVHRHCNLPSVEQIVEAAREGSDHE